MNEGRSLLTPCLKAFSTSEMKSSGATRVCDGFSGSETSSRTWRGRRMRIRLDVIAQEVHFGLERYRRPAAVVEYVPQQAAQVVHRLLGPVGIEFG